MHIAFVAPNFPHAQPNFPRAFASLGAKVTGIAEAPYDHLPADLKRNLSGYEYCADVKNPDALMDAVRRVNERQKIDRLECTIEFQMYGAAKAREALGIPGMSVESVLLARDKQRMKEHLRAKGIRCAQSSGIAKRADAEAFAAEYGYPLIVKPLDSAGADDTFKCANAGELAAALDKTKAGAGGRPMMIEEFIEGQEGFYDTLVVGGKIVFESVSFYYPNVLHAMRTRWISPQLVTTNRIDAPEHAPILEHGRQVIAAMGYDFAATHQEFFLHPEKGVVFSEIGARPPGCNWWNSYNWANDMDLFVEYARGSMFGKAQVNPSRRYSIGLVAIRPNQDGRVVGYSGIDAVRTRCGPNVCHFHLPDIGQATSPVEYGFIANGYVVLRHPDWDEMLRQVSFIGETLKIWAQ